MRFYVIPGDPTPLQRARLSSFKKVYDPQKNQKLLAGIALSAQHNDQPLFEGALNLDVIFFMKTPIKKRNQLMGKPHATKADLDNLIKFCCDVGNNILWHDDAQISQISAKKIYDPNPRTEFTIIELKNPKVDLK